MQKHPSPQIGDLFNRLNEELREKERVYVSYAEDRSDPRQTATQKLVERNVAAVRVEGARQEIAELVLHMDILYDEKLSILRAIGYATTFPSEQDEIDKLGIREGTEVKLGRFAIRVLGVEMMLFGGASGGCTARCSYGYLVKQIERGILGIESYRSTQMETRVA